MTLEYYNEY